MNIKFRPDPWLLIALPAWVYLIVRAALLDLTYDECWTFLGYAQAPIWDVLVNTHPAANNHVLHSLLMKASAFLFGTSPFALRIPVLLGFMAFALAVHQLLLGLPRVWRLFLMVALIYQPYVLDYFVAARGYGIALPGLLWSMVFLVRYAQRSDVKHLWMGGFASFLMAWANFTYLLPFVVWWLLALGFSWKHRKVKPFAAAALGFAGLAVLVYVPAILPLIEAKELYYGAASLNETVSSIGARFIYTLNEASWKGLLFAVLLGLSPLAWKLWDKQHYRFAAIGAALILGSLVLNVLQHVIMDAPYLIDRTGIFLIPLGLLALAGVGYWLPKNRSSVLAYFLLGAAILNAAMAMNFTHLIDFKDYADVSKAMEWVGEHVETREGEQAKIGKSTYLNAPINYYKQELELVQVAHSGLEYCDAEALYRVYYLFARDLACVQGKPVDTVAYYPVSDTYLFVQKEEGPTGR